MSGSTKLQCATEPYPHHAAPQGPFATRRGGAAAALRARKVLGWPKRRKLAHAFLWEYSYKRLKLAQLLGQLGVLLTMVHR